MKRIIICCDGTANKPDAKYVTNVVKIARGIVKESISGRTQQVVFYDQGVGSHGFFDTITGGALGHGLARNIREAYRFIVLNYSPGDELFLFGFSRGAFTVRSLSGLISKFGVLPATKVQQIRQTMDLYLGDKKPVIKGTHDASIKFLGVWDTVGALGVPTNRIAAVAGHWVGKVLKLPINLVTNTARILWFPHFGFFNKLQINFVRKKKSTGRRFRLPKGKYAFQNQTLSARVENGYHAVAIDERRPIFEALLWDTPPIKKQRIEQFWFSGAHADVGGGNANESTSAIALEWMSGRAKHHGLAFTKEFDGEVVKLLREKSKRISKSPTVMWAAAGSLWRKLDKYGTGTEQVHPTATDRFCAPKKNYAPENLKTYRDARGARCP